MLINCVILLSVAVVSTFAAGSMKNITVTGQVACSDRSQKDIEIQLWERDTLDPDDLLNTTKTDNHGRFRIFGQENEVNNIEPYLIIIHSCDNGVINPKCSIKDRYEIPRKYVGDTYNMGIVSLNIVKRRQKNCV
uniref:Bm6282 n=2 Tax=Brugia malayi TaxID=6279 RepID=A0A7I4KKW7_BRUMA